ncbi:MAG: hypothetical protein OEM01_05465 [Desulfobulbaceae bacterium]|nr:hypothetical protein [Desulfobulbaceae bacterium]
MEGGKDKLADPLRKAVYFSKLFSDRTKKVLIFSANRLEWIYNFNGSWENNCTVIPVDYLSTAEEVT